MTVLNVSDLTQETLSGSGVFDALMRANKAHLQAEFDKGRIKGPEYSTVYLGSLQSVMATALQFLVQKERIGLEAQLLTQQIALAAIEVQKANIALAILTASQAKIPVEIAQLTAQTALTDQQTTNLVAEALNIPKQGLVLDAQVCKLQAEFDLTVSTTLKSAQEITLLTQKVATERAQTTGLGVDADSVVGRQKALYQAQTTGFTRDAEQKAADLLVRSWSVQRTTDETGTTANATNMLNDATVGRVMTKLLAGVGA